jgi:AcrR family transcriptional regulator
MVTRWGDRENRRRDILDAGRALLREQGLGALQMREVARRAGIGSGTVYTYFATKESLYAAMYANRLDRMMADLEPALSASSDLEELFVLVATAYRDVYTEFGRDLDIAHALHRVGDVDAAISDELVDAAARVLDELRTTIADAGVAQPDQSLVVLWSTVTGLANHFTGPRHGLHTQSWDATVRFAAQTLVRGLLVKGNDND